jgi:transposase-like protein
LDATYVKARSGGRIVSKAVIVATCERSVNLAFCDH